MKQNTTSPIFQEMLPQGIWYEHDRKRFRIRLYHKGKCIFLRYEKTLEAALKALEEGKQFREEHAINISPIADDVGEVTKLTNLLKRFSSKPAS